MTEIAQLFYNVCAVVAIICTMLWVNAEIAWNWMDGDAERVIPGAGRPYEDWLNSYEHRGMAFVVFTTLGWPFALRAHLRARREYLSRPPADPATPEDPKEP